MFNGYRTNVAINIFCVMALQKLARANLFIFIDASKSCVDWIAVTLLTEATLGYFRCF
jgi:hypothetical protein